LPNEGDREKRIAALETKVARQFLSCEQGTVRTELGTAEGILEDLVGTDYSEVWFGDLATRFGHRRQSQCEKKLRALEALGTAILNPHFRKLAPRCYVFRTLVVSRALLGQTITQ